MDRTKKNLKKKRNKKKHEERLTSSNTLKKKLKTNVPSIRLNSIDTTMETTGALQSTKDVAHTASDHIKLVDVVDVNRNFVFEETTKCAEKLQPLDQENNSIMSLATSNTRVRLTKKQETSSSQLFKPTKEQLELITYNIFRNMIYDAQLEMMELEKAIASRRIDENSETEEEREETAKWNRLLREHQAYLEKSCPTLPQEQKKIDSIKSKKTSKSTKNKTLKNKKNIKNKRHKVDSLSLCPKKRQKLKSIQSKKANLLPNTRMQITKNTIKNKRNRGEDTHKSLKKKRIISKKASPLPNTKMSINVELLTPSPKIKRTLKTRSLQCKKTSPLSIITIPKKNKTLKDKRYNSGSPTLSPKVKQKLKSDILQYKKFVSPLPKPNKILTYENIAPSFYEVLRAVLKKKKNYFEDDYQRGHIRSSKPPKTRKKQLKKKRKKRKHKQKRKLGFCSKSKSTVCIPSPITAVNYYNYYSKTDLFAHFDMLEE